MALGAVPASAESITGIPVASLSSTSPVGLPIVNHDPTPDGVSNATGGWIRYYIPLESSSSGTYGVNGVGMSADTGNGPGWMHMNIMFNPSSTAITSASLLFEFSDLDLRYVNDPAGFLETVRVYTRDGSVLEAISPSFTQASTTSGTGIYNGVNYELSRQPGTAGASWPVTLNLWGSALTEMITDPFWVQLRFTVPSGVPYGTNTPEYLRATLTTTTAPEPEPVSEPGTVLLLGVVAAAAFRRRGLTSHTR